MNLGDNIVRKDIALFSKTEAEEAAMVLRYFYNKEKSLEKKAVYQECLEKLEKKLILTNQITAD
jgi:hypothetical protein